MKHKKILFILIVSLFFAQYLYSDEGNALSIRDLTIQIMPEYDLPDQWPPNTPALLVGYYGTFVNNTSGEFTGEIELDLPLDHPEFKINMICETEQGMACLPYRINYDGNTVVWKLSRTLKPGDEMPFMLEYYSSPFTSGDVRQFELSPVFRSDVINITVDISQPARSSNFSITPNPQRTQTRDGFNHSYLYYNDLKAGGAIDIAVSYLKADNNPSVSKESPLSMSDFQTSKESGGIDDTAVLVAVIISFSIIFFGIMIFLSFRSKGKPTYRTGRQVRSRIKSKNVSDMERKRIRKLLIDGKISEKTYKELLKGISGSRIKG